MKIKMPPDQYFNSNGDFVQNSDSDYLTVDDEYFNYGIDSQEEDSCIMQRMDSPIKSQDQLTFFQNVV